MKITINYETNLEVPGYFKTLPVEHLQALVRLSANKDFLILKSLMNQEANNLSQKVEEVMPTVENDIIRAYNKGARDRATRYVNFGELAKEELGRRLVDKKVVKEKQKV